MEQYYLPIELDFANLRKCLDNYVAEKLFIRLVGSKGGTVKVDESLEDRSLDFRKDSSGLYFLIDTEKVFHFPLKEIGTRDGNGFSLAYERIKPTEDGIGRMVMLPTGIYPYDPELPEPRRSILRHIFDEHLVEIYFKGRINLEFHSRWIKPHWKYWTIAD